MANGPTAVVTGMIATYPVGGVLFDYGQYALGLERLGFDVYYLEDTGGPTYDPHTRIYGPDASYGVQFLPAALETLSPRLACRWHFRDVEGRSYGLPQDEMNNIVAKADLFLNVSGGTLLRDEYLPSRRKVLIDTDPGWNHFVNYPRWDESPGWKGTHGYRAHDHFFTYAENIGLDGCLLPGLGLDWLPTRPPVVLDLWQPEPPGEIWTTVLTWKNFQQSIEHAGKSYGTKELEFDKVESLPSLVPARLEMAIGGAEAPVEHWRSLGWSITSSVERSVTPADYRHYIQSSRGEFSVAKNVYVDTLSGWFSCRSICYLAAGRPAVVQDTGFTRRIPAGKGLLAFSSLDEAVAAVAAVEADYDGHQQAALEIARRYFSAEQVLGDMLKRVGL